MYIDSIHLQKRHAASNNNEWHCGQTQRVRRVSTVRSVIRVNVNDDKRLLYLTHNTQHKSSHTHTQTPRCLSFETIAKSRLESSFRNLGQTRNRTLQKSNILGGSHDQACSSWKIIDTAASRGQTRITTIGARIDDSMLLLLYIRWWWWWWWCEQKIIIILRLSRSRQQSS